MKYHTETHRPIPAEPCTDFGMEDRHSWLREFNRPVDWFDVCLAVIAVVAWAMLFFMVVNEVAR
jgi:hypothetical protein